MRWTIRKKFLIGYFVLFTVAASLVHQVMKNAFETNNRAMIEYDVTKLQHTTREHIKQFAVIHSPQDNLLSEYGSVIAQELSKLHNQSVALFDRDGHFLYEAVPFDQPLLVENQIHQTDATENKAPELQLAFQNQSAYTHQIVPGGHLVYFAYPLYMDDQFYGVLRFTGDYTEMLAANEKILHWLTMLLIALFIGVFAISSIVTTQIIKPLVRLTAATKRVAAGQYDMDVDIHTKDELETLADGFHHMQRSIRQQIDMIEAEKDKVMRLEKSRTAFFNNVTHELKTPLATISGYAQIIGEEDFKDFIFLRKATRKIQRESERLNRMVVELIALSKNESDDVIHRKEPVKVQPLLRSVCDDLSLRATDRKMHIEIEGDASILYGNEEELRQAFLNVLENAVKHGKATTVITVTISGGSMTVMNESDSIPEEIVKQAFEPFIHTKGEGNNGLGLTIVKQLITKQKGTITFAYIQGRAITRIHLPLWQQNGNNCG